jgi:hypothetical protein
MTKTHIDTGYSVCAVLQQGLLQRGENGADIWSRPLHCGALSDMFTKFCCICHVVKSSTPSQISQAKGQEVHLPGPRSAGRPVPCTLQPHPEAVRNEFVPYRLSWNRQPLQAHSGGHRPRNPYTCLHALKSRNADTSRILPMELNANNHTRS